ncbi:MAG TPA: condensation domain-containing protein, partial [Chthonomonadaceae bacterium]|nr:condensation domain-containing protein [Chthonomonadaceae bacterium]
LQPNSTLYNIPRALLLKGNLDMAALQQALEQIFTRHQVLRTTYAARAGQPYQTVSEDTAFPLPLQDLSHLDPQQRQEEALRLSQEEANRPFDMANDSMMRAQLLRLQPQEHVLLLTQHHIASDGWSNSILTRELSALYNAFQQGLPSPLPDLPIQYADYAVWQRNWLQGEALERQVSYWRERLSGAPPVLALPTDRPREEADSYQGAMHRFTAPEALGEGLRRVCREERATPFMVLLAAFQVLLYRWTGQPDLVVGTDVANRTQAETEGLIGFFLNHLVLRTDLSGDVDFREVVRRVREGCLGAYAHQDLPFDKLVEVLQPERSGSHTPIFQVLFVVQNVPEVRVDMRGVDLSSYGRGVGSSKFDLSLFLGESGGEMEGAWVYRTDLFEASSIGRLSGQFLSLLDELLSHPDIRIEDVELWYGEGSEMESAAASVSGGVRGSRRRSRVVVERG